MERNRWQMWFHECSGSSGCCLVRLSPTCQLELCPYLHPLRHLFSHPPPSTAMAPLKVRPRVQPRCCPHALLCTGSLGCFPRGAAYPRRAKKRISLWNNKNSKNLCTKIKCARQLVRGLFTGDLCWQKCRIWFRALASPPHKPAALCYDLLCYAMLRLAGRVWCCCCPRWSSKLSQ